uniref:Uncharacterized protein n=1 Tax=Molossus molossus TaxID=27622 RepID=A0A7J8FA99_MOLMO|nr:hypothetical protein HJG59_008610 [Molossus molossus]
MTAPGALVGTYCPSGRHPGSLAGRGLGGCLEPKDSQALWAKLGVFVWVLDSQAETCAALRGPITGGAAPALYRGSPQLRPQEVSTEGCKGQSCPAQRASARSGQAKGPASGAIPVSSRGAGWLPTPGSEAHKSWLMVGHHSPLGCSFRTTQTCWGPHFSAVDPA